MSKKLVELSDSISNDLLSEFDETDRFTKIDVEMLILGAVVKAYESFIKEDKPT